MILERAKLKAAALLLRLPPTDPEPELSIRPVDDHEVWLGMGWLVASGWAVYRGDMCFQFSKTGRAVAFDYVREQMLEPANGER